MNSINESEKAYIAGFLDGDGCINAQLVRRHEYRLLFQVQLSITFFQSTKRHWFLLQLHKLLGCGYVRKRYDGISEYCVVGIASVSALCKALHPYLRLKQRQATLTSTIIERLSRHQSASEFLALCELVDQIGALNDCIPKGNRKAGEASALGTKNSTVTTCLVRKELDLLFPVETSETKNIGDIASG